MSDALAALFDGSGDQGMVERPEAAMTDRAGALDKFVFGRREAAEEWKKRSQAWPNGRNSRSPGHVDAGLTYAMNHSTTAASDPVLAAAAATGVPFEVFGVRSRRCRHRRRSARRTDTRLTSRPTRSSSSASPSRGSMRHALRAHLDPPRRATAWSTGGWACGGHVRRRVQNDRHHRHGDRRGDAVRSAAGLPIWIDAAVMACDRVIVGGGSRDPSCSFRRRRSARSHTPRWSTVRPRPNPADPGSD